MVYHRTLNIVPLLYSRTMFIHPVYNGLPLLTPKSHSTPPPFPSPMATWNLPATSTSVSQVVSGDGTNPVGLRSQHFLEAWAPGLKLIWSTLACGHARCGLFTWIDKLPQICHVQVFSGGLYLFQLGTECWFCLFFWLGLELAACCTKHCWTGLR